MKLNYNDCQRIVKNCDNFYEKVEIINGVKISIFNYTLSILDFFKKPIKEEDLTAFELRGITFIHDPSKTEPERCLMLTKFLNVNEGIGFREEDLKDWNVIRVQEKMDGSMIRFLLMPDGQIIAKTKAGFGNDQSQLAMDCFNQNENIRDFISDTLTQKNKLSAIFEIVSPFNQIVCEYQKTELVLLQLRDEESGNYLDIYENELVKKHNIKCSKKEQMYSLPELLALKETIQGTEGWVITLEKDGETKLVKIKTKWYMDRFHLVDKVSAENILIELIIDEKIDDAMSILDNANPYKDYCHEVQEHMGHYLARKTKDIIELINKFNGSRKDFFLTHGSNPDFHTAYLFVEKSYQFEDVVKQLKTKIKKDTYRLNNAKKFLKDSGFQSNIKLSVKED